MGSSFFDLTFIFNLNKQMYHKEDLSTVKQLFLILLLCLPIMGWGQSVQLSAKSILVKELFQEMNTQADVNFVYSDLGDELNKKITLAKQSASVKELLDDITKQTNLRFTRNGKDVIVRRLVASAAQKQYASVVGVVEEPMGKLRLGYANVYLQSLIDTSRYYRTVAGSDGTFVFAAVARGAYRLGASYVGYYNTPKVVSLQGNEEINVELLGASQLVEDIYVTGVEQRGMTSSSIINREAIDHMQATSISDLMSLLPGGQAIEPSLTLPNLANLREANPPDNRGRNYTISSLGTLFVIDDIPLSMDANRQASDQVVSQTTGQLYVETTTKEYVNFGVDMRSLTTDNIESLEVIRGIPSVRYGDLTSGVIKIERRQKAVPLTARFKADQFSKLISISKGINLKNNWILNADVDYLDGKSDPVDPLNTYDRYNLSVRSDKRWSSSNGNEIRWNVALDYSGQFDDWKNDREQLLDQEKYKLTYKAMGFSSRLSWSPREKIIEAVDFNVGLRYSVDNIYQERWPSNRSQGGIVPIYQGTGVGEAIVLPATYLASLEVDGRPLNAYATLRNAFKFNTHNILHNLQVGIEWKTDKNFGAGQIFDISRPISNGFAVRPYRYDTTPAMHHLSYYGEEKIEFPKLYGNTFILQAGLRGGTMLNLDQTYKLNGKFYTDPRINLQWELPNIDVNDGPLQLAVTGGIGWLSKMPTMSMLYPDILYQDFIEFQHANSQPEYSYYQLRTYEVDRVNYELMYARNKKKELRLDATWKDHHFSITWFDEILTNGFRFSSEPTSYYYQSYGTFSQPQYPTKPDLSEMSYTERNVFVSTARQTNGTKLTKRGLEFSFRTPRYPVISTRFTVTGAYFKNDYLNSEAMWFTGNSQNNPSVGDVVIFQKYAALYPNWRDGFYRTRTSTNFTADTYIKRFGLTLSLTAETYWKGLSNQWDNNPGYPSYYLTTDNVLHEYTEADKQDLYLSFLYYPDQFVGTVLENRFQIKGHFRGSKDFGDWLRLSLFVLNFADYNPGYLDQTGVYVKNANGAPYFGMELKLKLK